MMIVKKLNMEVYKCIFHKDHEDNIMQPIMLESAVNKYNERIDNERKK